MAEQEQEGSWAEENRGESQQGQQGKININQASQQELMQVQGIGPERAQDIIQYREQHGGFQSVDELDEIPGFAGTLTNDLKQRLVA